MLVRLMGQHVRCALCCSLALGSGLLERCLSIDCTLQNSFSSGATVLHKLASGLGLCLRQGYRSLCVGRTLGRSLGLGSSALERSLCRTACLRLGSQCSCSSAGIACGSRGQ